MQKRGWWAATGVVAVLMMVAAPALAQWSGKGEVGVALASGNTDTQTANAKIAAGYKDEAWEHSGTFAMLYVRNEGETTGRRWEATAQSRYNFSEDGFWFGALRYEEDRFSGFDHQGVINTGLGRKFIASERTKLSAQVGIGYKLIEPLDPLSAPEGADNSAVGVASLDFEHRINDFTRVFNRFASEFTSDNNFLQNEVGVAVRMSNRMALSLAYAVRHNTDPPATFKKTDTLSTINLVYELK